MTERARWSTRITTGTSHVRSLAAQSRDVLVVAALVGAATGFAVAGFEAAVAWFLERLDDLPLWLVAVMPLAGLTVAAAILAWIGRGASPATADEYIEAFHDPGHRLATRPFVARVLAGIATLGSGAPMGLEGPSLYIGAGIGDMLQRRFPRVFTAERVRLLMVAGAGAGVAAIFKAPATGAVFALEVPFRRDFAHRMLAPTLVSSAAGYLAYVAVHGTDPLIEIAGSPQFSFLTLVAAIALGVIAGTAARAFAWSLRHAKRLAARWKPYVRVPLASLVLIALFVICRAATGESLTTGPGYRTIQWALDPTRASWAIALVLFLRCVGTSAAVGGGGVGGLFVPLVVAGALTGRLVGGEINALDTSLFTVIGVAAFLAAGYRVPLAAVIFVAEATGGLGFVVPGLLAAVTADLMMGMSSVTIYQRDTDEAPVRDRNGEDPGPDVSVE